MITKNYWAILLLQKIGAFRYSAWLAPGAKLFELTGMDIITSLKLLAEVAFSIVCWYLILCYIPELILVVAGTFGASGFCLWKVMACCSRIAGESITIRITGEQKSTMLSKIVMVV